MAITVLTYVTGHVVSLTFVVSSSTTSSVSALCLLQAPLTLQDSLPGRDPNLRTRRV